MTKKEEEKAVHSAIDAGEISAVMSHLGKRSAAKRVNNSEWGKMMAKKRWDKNGTD